MHMWQTKVESDLIPGDGHLVHSSGRMHLDVIFGFRIKKGGGEKRGSKSEKEKGFE